MDGTNGPRSELDSVGSARPKPRTRLPFVGIGLTLSLLLAVYVTGALLVPPADDVKKRKETLAWINWMGAAIPTYNDLEPRDQPRSWAAIAKYFREGLGADSEYALALRNGRPLDAWGTPIVYIHHLDYGTARDVRTTTFDFVGIRFWKTQQVKAIRNPGFVGYSRAERFQIISAGADRTFGTADDITNLGMR